MTNKRIDNFFNQINDQLKIAQAGPTAEHKVDALMPVVQSLANVLRDAIDGKFEPWRHAPTPAPQHRY